MTERQDALERQEARADLTTETARQISEASVEEIVKAVSAELSQQRKAFRQKRLDLDVRGILAIMSLLGAFGLAFLQLQSPLASAEIPAWAAAIVAGVSGFYFGSRAGTGSDGKE